jgi:hypothetical protein
LRYAWRELGRDGDRYPMFFTGAPGKLLLSRA